MIIKELNYYLLSRSKKSLLLTSYEQKELLDILKNNVENLDEDTVFSVLLNLRVLFFERFNYKLRDEFVYTLIRNNPRDLTIFSNSIELMGIIFKHCSEESKNNIYNYIIHSYKKITSSINSIVAFCNFSWISFNGLTKNQQNELFQIIYLLKLNNTNTPVFDTIDYTYRMIEKEIRGN